MDYQEDVLDAHVNRRVIARRGKDALRSRASIFDNRAQRIYYKDLCEYSAYVIIMCARSERLTRSDVYDMFLRTHIRIYIRTESPIRDIIFSHVCIECARCIHKIPQRRGKRAVWKQCALYLLSNGGKIVHIYIM